jgi:hypothetical protein
MDLKTTFVKTDDLFIRIDEETEFVRLGGRRLKTPFFSFQTVTEVKFSDDKIFSVRVTRSMSSGLLKYFLANQRFQEQVLRENQAHAVKHFNSR